MHELALPLLIGLIAVALAFDFLNGLHDAANSIATVVATRLLAGARRCCSPRCSTSPPIS
jgi:PiT family inorganic phosphate transporter